MRLLGKDGFSAEQVNFTSLSSGVGTNVKVLKVKFPLSDMTSLSVTSFSESFHHVIIARGLEPEDSHSKVTDLPADR